MNDDELRRQLERRAASGDGTWVRRGLLPAVSAAMRDGSPERVVGRGLSPLGALAAVAAVVVLVVGLAIVRPPSPPPAGSQSPPSPAPSVPVIAVDCQLEPLPGDPRPSVQPPASSPRVSDATGLVEECTVERVNEMGPAAARVLADRASPRNLRVEWHGTPCDAAATLHLSGSSDDVHLLVEYPGGNCDSMGVAHAVTLRMTHAVDPDDVTVRAETPTGQQGIDWAEVEADDAAFELRILSPASTFVAGEPIEGITAELVYVGDQPEIAVSGTGSLIAAFSADQLDGPLSMPAEILQQCAAELLWATIPYVRHFDESVGFASDDPSADLHEDWLDDPGLRLPAGRWQLTAYSTFTVGGCGEGGRSVELEASVVLDVVDEAATEPTPLPSGTSLGLDCASVMRPALGGATPGTDRIWRLSVDDTTGLVFGCRANADRPVAPDEPIMVRASEPDVGAHIEVVWMGDPCRDDVVIRLDPLGTGPTTGAQYALEVEEIDEGISCYALPVERSAVLFTRQPIDPAAVDASLEPGGFEPSPSPSPSVSPSPTVAPTPRREPLPTPLDNVEPYWELAPEERPTASSTSIDVLVHEMRCSSGISVKGRITGVEVLYGLEEVTITIGVRPLRGDRNCEPAPPAAITVELSEPLGNRRLVDGGSGLWVVWEHTDSFLGLTVRHSSTYDAERRLAARAGRACALSLDRSRARPTDAEAEEMANEAPEGYGLVGGGRAWLGDWRDAAHAFGALEAYGWEFEWLFMGVAAGQEWLHVELPAGTLFVTDLYPIEVSGGRTLWVPNVDRLWIPPTSDDECPR